ncbi:rho GTPase-activating protein 39-like [Discoglossus pictus]
MAEGSDWVEIIEPRTHERMYVNLTTGECGWDPPPDVPVRQSNESQWWELYDQQSGRFYYYNALTRQTVWHRPQQCDIVPLAKLQAVKRASQPSLAGTVSLERMSHRGSTSSEGTNTPLDILLLQDAEYGKDGGKKRGDSIDSRKDSGRWQPIPGTKAAMLVKVNSLRHAPVSPTNTNTPKTFVPKPAVYAQPQLPSSAAAPVVDPKQSMQIKKTDNGGFCLVLTNGANCQTPQRTPTGTLQPSSPRYGSPPPIYDEPSIDSPIYDEPPVEMDFGSMTVKTVSPPLSPTGSLHSQPQTMKLLPYPSVNQHKHKRNPSATEYTAVGREYIKHMVNVDQSSKQTISPTGSLDTPPKHQPGQLALKDSFKNSWRVLEANVLKNLEAHHGRQNSLPQDYPTVVSQQDSGYSTGPSPSLRKRKGRRQGASQIRPGSVGSSSELNALNDKLIAEMRSVVNRTAVCRGSKNSLDTEMVETIVPTDGNKVRFQADPLKKSGGRGSRDDITSSSRSLFRPTAETQESGNTEVTTQQEVIRQKRTYEKIDFLEKKVTSQISLLSSGSNRTASQSGTLETNPTGEGRGQTGFGPGYQFNYTTLRKPLSQTSMVDWASKNLNMHTQGIFRRRISISNMLSWNGGSIKKPMLITSNRVIKKEACEMFKLVQVYMGDRQARTDRNQVALVLVTKCWSTQGLRDELYMQLVRQTTNNMTYRSLSWGWELIAISLGFFSPSPKFQSYLEGYIYKHLDEASDQNINQRIQEIQELKTKKISKSRKKRKQNVEDEEGLPISTYAKYCYRKLQKVAVTGGKKGLRKPTVEEIEQARQAILTPSLFGSSLEEIMERQQEMYPDRRLPWVQTQLSQKVLDLGGEKTEGIFRVPGDIDEVNALKVQVEQWRIPENFSDPTVPASLLKLWYRELEEPLIPQQFYKQCISNYENPDAAVSVVQQLPELNRLVLCYLIHFLQIFSQPSNVGTTKMDVNNLAMVMAPNCLRCQSDDPRIIFENTRKEMSFLRMLIVHLDTSYVRGLL